jgi:hypothetical protein
VELGLVVVALGGGCAWWSAFDSSIKIHIIATKTNTATTFIKQVSIYWLKNREAARNT